MTYKIINESLFKHSPRAYFWLSFISPMRFLLLLLLSGAVWCCLLCFACVGSLLYLSVMYVMFGFLEQVMFVLLMKKPSKEQSGRY